VCSKGEKYSGVACALGGVASCSSIISGRLNSIRRRTGC
jgi:hypothetical protein